MTKTPQYERMAQLGRHHRGVVAPEAAQITPHVFTQNGHTFLQVGSTWRRISNRDNQVYVKDRYGGRWNLVRLLLERAGRLDQGTGWRNVCGFTECIDIEHWKPTRVVRGAPRYEVVPADGHAWLVLHDERVARDVLLAAQLGDAPGVHHVRYLYDPIEPRFVTACGINMNPFTLQLRSDVDCRSCLS